LAAAFVGLVGAAASAHAAGGTGSISGVVTSTSKSKQKVCVDTLEATPTAKVSPGGSYTLSGLVPGSYAVAFGSCKRHTYDYVTQYYDDQLTTPDYVTVTAGVTTPNINATMTMGGDITGSVTNDNEYATVVIEAVSTNGGPTGEVDINTNTDPAGTYTLSGLHGSYTVSFYYGVDSEEVVSYPDQVVVRSNHSASGIDETIPSGF
jgi:hypothetical protein